MIITQTPLRISIGGGGTDLPSYYSRHGGFFVSAAIDKYLYIALQRTSSGEPIVLKYSKMERVESVDEIEHDIVRELLRSHGLTSSFEMASFADIPSSTGLGSSGSFTVGLLRGLYALRGERVTPEHIADEASRLVMETLKRPDGKQDQYVASYGGFNCYHIDTDGTVTVSPLRISNKTLNILRDRLALFFTGLYRQSESILNIQREKSEQGDARMIEGLHFIKETGHNIRASLEGGDPDEFGRMMHEHWMKKKERATTMSNPRIDGWYEEALRAGSYGGKVIGAGGGGYLLFYTPDKDKLIAALSESGLQHVPFDFTFEGARELVNSNYP